MWIEWIQCGWRIYVFKRNVVLPLETRVVWVKASPGETILAKNTFQKVKTVVLRKYMEIGREIKTLYA